MKTISRTLLSFFTFLLVLVGCENTQKKELAAKFDKLEMQHDSLEQVHAEFKTVHSEMTQKHQEFTTALEGMELQDSTILEDVAKHEAILKKHEATIEGHDAMIAAHEELKAGFEEKSEEKLLDKTSAKIVLSYSTVEILKKYINLIKIKIMVV